MKIALAMLTIVALSPAARGDLLINGNLNLLTPSSSPALYYDTPTGWILSTNPQSFPQPNDPNPAIVRYPALPASYADRGGAGNGVVFQSTEGNFPGFPDVTTVDADLFQAVPGVAGLIYELKGWAYFEGGYAGGVDTISAASPSPRAGLPALTDTVFALEFLNAIGTVLPSSTTVELKADGQVNNPDPTETTRNWLEHTLTAVAPLGTASVRVRASMIDGEFNIDLPHQTAFVDDFSLNVLPEPSSAAAFIALCSLLTARARRRPGRL